MSIKDFSQKIKSIFRTIQERTYDLKKHLEIKNDLFLALLILLVGLASFGLGKLSALEKQKTPVSVIQTEESISAIVSTTTPDTGAENTASTSQKGTVFSSKSGTKYYYPWCSGAKRVTDANRVWFQSIAEAKAAGLTPAANCPGLN